MVKWTINLQTLWTRLTNAEHFILAGSSRAVQGNAIFNHRHTERFILHRMFQDETGSLINRLALIWEVILNTDSPDSDLCKLSFFCWSILLFYPLALKCKSLMSAHFLADCLTGMTLNTLCPLPNLLENKRHTQNPFCNLSSRAGKQEKYARDRNWFHVFLHLLSQSDWHSLSLPINQTRCRKRSTAEQTCWGP